MQPILIDFDGTADFLMAVRLRGELCQTINPLRADMSIFDQRVKRADHQSTEDLRFAVGKLAREMATAVFAGDVQFARLRSDNFKGEPLSRYECVVLVQTFLGLAAQARGQDPRPYLDGSFSLIAEDDGVTRARAQAAANLPPGRVIGAAGVRPIAPSEARAETAPHPEATAAQEGAKRD